MLQNFINDKPEEAQLDFHQYIGNKMSIVSGLKQSETNKDNENEE
jgi:hypothetical protein